jgi:hypothetical protein
MSLFDRISLFIQKSNSCKYGHAERNRENIISLSVAKKEIEEITKKLSKKDNNQKKQ